jgi:predicted pyridoxine 5'-phosphate oxidase superfamily flavin-nucleotide-binding protein
VADRAFGIAASKKESGMATLTEDMKRVIREQRLGYVATVCPDGTPNVSPKGTLTVWDDDHVVFADIRSPRTIANLKQNPSLEINVVDWFTRKGYRLKGIASVIESGALFDELVAFYAQQGLSDAPRRIQAVVMIQVQRALPLVSPAYDSETTEDQVRARWEDHYQQIRPKR